MGDTLAQIAAACVVTNQRTQDALLCKDAVSIGNIEEFDIPPYFAHKVLDYVER